MINRLFFKDKPIIGIEIDQTTLKVMAIDAKKMLVQGYGSVQLDPAKVHESLEGEDDYLADSMSLLLSNKLVGRLPSNHVAISVPASKTFTRTFTVPSSVEPTIKDAVNLEVDQYIPVPSAALYVDYQIIDRTKNDLTILISAVPRKIIDTCVKAVDRAGYRLCSVMPSTNAVARLLERTEEGHLPTVIVDIGPATTDIAILDGAVRLTGSTQIGGNSLTLTLSRKMNITLENAHQLKVINGINPGPRQAKLKAALRPELDKIVSETRKVMRYYNERLIADRQKLEQVLLVGSGANLPGIGEYFTNELVMPARVASPWQALDFGKLEKPSRQLRPHYITVAGLASLEPKEVRV